MFAAFNTVFKNKTLAHSGISLQTEIEGTEDWKQGTEVKKPVFSCLWNKYIKNALSLGDNVINKEIYLCVYN